jgi:hypothetical protein
MVESKVFDKLVEELADYIMELQEKHGLTDGEVKDLIDIVRSMV